VAVDLHVVEVSLGVVVVFAVMVQEVTYSHYTESSSA